MFSKNPADKKQTTLKTTKRAYLYEKLDHELAKSKTCSSSIFLEIYNNSELREY